MKELNKTQQEIFNNIISSSNRLTLISGQAGTGKTFLANEIVNYYKSKYCIAITAPTNKAVKVLIGKSGNKNWESGKTNNSNIIYTTLHKLLKFRSVIEDDGTQHFEPDYSSIEISRFKIIIIDEVSMCDDFLLDTLLNISPMSTRIIFLGDRYQIPPVNYIDNMILRKEVKDVTEYE